MDTKKNINIQDEKGLKVIAVIILIAGIIISGILGFTSIFIDLPQTQYLVEYIFNPIGFVITLGTLVSSIGLYFFLIVIANISISLKENKHSNVQVSDNSSNNRLFKNGDSVLDIETGKEMIIRNYDSKIDRYICYSNKGIFEGSFSESNLKSKKS